MEIFFGQSKCRKKCVELSKIYDSYVKKGKECKNRDANIYAKIVSFLSSMDNFGVTQKDHRFKIHRGHPLEPPLKGKWAFDMVHPKRFIFEPCWPSDEAKKNLDYYQVKRISVFDIDDYH